MKIAVFSDIHSNLEVLEAIIEDVKKNSFDEIICLGDTIGLATNPKECLDLLFENNIKILLGNHDLYYLYGTNIDPDMTKEEIKHHDWINKKIGIDYKEKLMNCDIEYTITTDNKNITFKHFFLSDLTKKYPFYSLRILYNNQINDVLKNSNSDIIFYGHEHKPTKFKYKNKLAIGIGSSGCVTNNKTFYTIININKRIEINKKTIKYDREKFINKIKNEAYPEREFIAKIFFGIDI